MEYVHFTLIIQINEFIKSWLCYSAWLIYPRSFFKYAIFCEISCICSSGGPTGFFRRFLLLPLDLAGQSYIYGTISVCIAFHCCLLCFIKRPVSEEGPQYQRICFLVISKISFECLNFKRHPYRFKIGMEIIRQTIMHLETSWIQIFLQSFLWCSQGSNWCKHAVATQWQVVCYVQI